MLSAVGVIADSDSVNSDLIILCLHGDVMRVILSAHQQMRGELCNTSWSDTVNVIQEKPNRANQQTMR